MRRTAKFNNENKIYIPLVLAALLFLLIGADTVHAADISKDLAGVKEGWAWPVVVVPPPEGWNSPTGNSIKYAMRTAEREISLKRGGIRGKEVTFMFSNLSSHLELGERLRTWRAMGVYAIVSFGGGEMDDVLKSLCSQNGPSVLFVGGEELPIIDPNTGRPYPYLFTLDLPYFARANALAEIAATENPKRDVAVITDVMSVKLAKGAALNVDYLRLRGINTMDLSVSAYRQDQFAPQVRNSEESGVGVFISWLDSMATLSIWRTAYQRPNKSIIYHAGNQHRILLDAEGLILVDKDVLLERNTDGRRHTSFIIRDTIHEAVDDPVIAAKAYALGKWAISAYMTVISEDVGAISETLAQTAGIPLMDEDLSINPLTHRPVSRKFGVLRIQGRQYVSNGLVEVFSSEASE
ncbi:MAG: ABC transporter substrate-binding protein [Synergistaceae bacterium]|jgi:hypothetical protein|nr:ABC transporter substrate-binding protein [Synergistaceae bacterium]